MNPFLPHRTRSILSLVFLWNIYLDVSPILGDAEVDKYLEMGTKLLAAGQLADALAQYNFAVDKDSENFLTYFRRATVYMAMGKTKSALPDLDKSIELKPDFIPARIQRGNVHLKNGRIGEAKQDYKQVLAQDSGNHEAQQQLEVLGQLDDKVESAKAFYENNMFHDAISFLDQAIDVMPMSEELRELRANSYLQLGDKNKAIQDFRFSVKLSNDNTDGLLKLSKLMYEAGEAELSLEQIRECLRLDPDHKACFDHYKGIKKLVKLLESTQAASNENRFEDCIQKSEKIIKNEGHIEAFRLTATQHICRCKTKMGSVDAIAPCTDVINAQPNNEEAILDRAESYINSEQYDEAIRDYQSILENDRRHKKANDGIKKAQKLKKNSKRRDYYKILGVPKHATKKEIMKAYRKLAAAHHPDRFSEAEKKAAEKKFIDITDAKEVLTDDEKRSKFDNGEDPLDPEQQQGGHGHHGGGFPFGFNPFGDGGGGGGNYHYEFHFG